VAESSPKQAKKPQARKPIVAILSTGDEVVGGRTLDTNATYIADQVGNLGLEVVSKITVGDYVDRIAWGWDQLLAQADVVISTGGLGPTADDLTNETVARVAGVPQVRDQEQADKIRGFFELVGRHMPENNLKQADIPEGAVVISNDLGTAPGYRLEMPRDGRRPVGVVLPGVPREMKPMLQEHVLPWLASLSGGDHVVRSRTFQTFGMSESGVDDAVAGAVDPSEGRLAFRASFPTIAVRLTVSGTESDCDAKLARLGDAIAARLGDAVYAEGDVSMEEKVGELLTAAGKTVATAESCTGGLVGNRLTDVAGSSRYYIGGVVAYSNDVKQGIGVSPQTLLSHGAVSEETAQEMAAGVRVQTGADIGIATTGVAGPGGGSDTKPVGTVAIAIATGDNDVKSRIYQLWGTRDWIKMLTSQVALDWIRRQLLGMDPLDSNFGKRTGAISGKRGGAPS
jgi:nicotinamide-nucleotide amidase